jgi:hypothetical protein
LSHDPAFYTTVPLQGCFCPASGLGAISARLPLS